MSRPLLERCGRGHLFDENNTHLYRDKTGRLHRVCRACAKQRNGFRRRLYGLSDEDFQERLDEQNAVCAICGKDPGDRSLAVDHDHASGSIRGLLCSTCNTGIGGLKDDPELLRRAITYLQSHVRGQHIAAMEQPALADTDRQHVTAAFDVVLAAFTDDIERLAGGSRFSDTFMATQLTAAFANRYDARFAVQFLVATARVQVRLEAGACFPAECVAEEVAIHAVLRVAADLATEADDRGAERVEAFMHGILPDLDFLLLFDAGACLSREHGQAIGATHLWFEEWFRPFQSFRSETRAQLN